MDYQIQGKTAFVSAGAHGIGEAIADLLTQEGASVIVADSDESALKEKGRRWKATSCTFSIVRFSPSTSKESIR